jgi:ribosomal-protein-alanine N-acetyltransferase
MVLEFADQELPGGLILRVMRETDAPALAAAYVGSDA